MLVFVNNKRLHKSSNIDNNTLYRCISKYIQYNKLMYISEEVGRVRDRMVNICISFSGFIGLKSDI